ncbi:hypothetical protein [Peribacillus muralis]|uniref:hypothetical protein n=1 Tax=Peribacillus muralis TaxID=264697 RepID=UPI00366AF574
MTGSVFGGSAAVFANEVENPATSQEETVNDSNLSQQLIDTMDQYIILNEFGEFFIDPSVDLSKILSEEELKIVEESIENANAINSETIENQDVNPGNVVINNDSVTLSIYDSELIPQKDRAIMARAYYNGVTKISSYWWGFKVYLSKTVINTAGSSVIGAAGYYASTLKVPHPIGYAIAAGLGAAGYLGTNIKYGVELRINKTFISQVKIKYIPTGVKYQSK